MIDIGCFDNFKPVEPFDRNLKPALRIDRSIRLRGMHYNRYTAHVAGHWRQRRWVFTSPPLRHLKGITPRLPPPDADKEERFMADAVCLRSLGHIGSETSPGTLA